MTPTNTQQTIPTIMRSYRYLGPFGKAKSDPWARSAPKWTVYSKISELPGVISEIGQLVEELRYPPTLREYDFGFGDDEGCYEEGDNNNYDYEDCDDYYNYCDDDDDDSGGDSGKNENEDGLLGPEYDKDGEAIEGDGDGYGAAEEEKGLDQSEIELLLAHSDLIRKTGEKIEDLPEDLSKLIEKARKMPIEKVIPEKIPEATASRIRAVFKKVSRKECRKMETPVGCSDTEKLHARRKLAASIRDRAIRATNAFRNSVHHQETEHHHTSPCDSSYHHGRWFRSQCNASRCSKAHTKDQLRRGILGRLCKYDGGKGLCSTPGCNYRHTKLGPAGCTCGLYDLLAAVRNCKRKRTVIETPARILCECPRVPESLVEKRPFSSYVRRALAAQETDERHRHRYRERGSGSQRRQRQQPVQRKVKPEGERRESAPALRRPAEKKQDRWSTVARKSRPPTADKKPDKDGWSTVTRKSRRRR